MADFYNRDQEIQSYEFFISTAGPRDPRCLVYRAGPASGLTQFFLDRERQRHKRNLPIYINTGSHQGLNLIFTAFFERLKKLHPWRWIYWDLRLHWKERLLELSKGLLPAFGGDIVTDASEAIATVAPGDVTFSTYPSRPAERFARAVRLLSRRHTIIMILDNAQTIDAASIDMFRTTFSETYYDVRYVLGFVDRPDASITFDDFLIRLKSTGHRVKTLPFQKPGPSLIRLIAAASKIKLSEAAAENVAAQHDHNIHRILASIFELSQRGGESRHRTRSPIAKEILGLLAVAGQGLRTSDLLGICTTSPEIYFQSPDEVHATVRQLQAEQVVDLHTLDDGDQRASLLLNSDDVIASAVEGRARRLALANSLYRYFSRVPVGQTRHSPSAIASLLFRLAKDVDPEAVPYRAQKLISRAMAMGSISGARDYIATAIPLTSISSFSDFFVRVAFLISVKAYQEALAYLQDPPDTHWATRRICRVLLAVCLNRCRHHARSLQVIEALLADCPTPEERALLVSYKISGILHEQRPSAAQATFDLEEPRLRSAENYAYFLRNGAAAFPVRAAIQVTHRAVREFKRKRDAFGELTAISNIGSHLASLRELPEASGKFEHAYGGLAVYGTQHLEEAACNIGLVRVLQGRFAEADQSLERFLRHASAKMPRLYGEMHFAITKVYQNAPDEALQWLSAADETLKAVRVKTARQRYAANALLIAFLSKAPKRVLDARLREATAAPHGVHPETTTRIVRYVREKRSEGGTPKLPKVDVLASLYSCGWLQYWSQNPLQVLSKITLPSQTVSQYVA